MKKVFLEIYSKYIEGKIDLKVFGDFFESIDTDELINTFIYFNDITITPNNKTLEFNGQLKEMNLSVLDRKRLENKWTKLVIEDEIHKQKVHDFFIKNKEKIYKKIKNDLKLDEIRIDREISHKIEKPKNFYFKLIGEKISNIFPNTNIYDTGKNITFWSKANVINLDKSKITELLNVLSIINVKKYDFAFNILPLYDYADEKNEKIRGINITLNIFY